MESGFGISSCFAPCRRSPPTDEELGSGGGSGVGRFTAVAVILFVFVALAAAAVVIYLLVVQRFACCDRGEYECDGVQSVKARDDDEDDEDHVAAWDLPSLDYLSEEQTMKYLRRHREDQQQHRRDEQAGEDAEVIRVADVDRPSPTSSSSSSSHGVGSLPESDRDAAQANKRSSGSASVNRAFVHENDGQNDSRGKIV